MADEMAVGAFELLADVAPDAAEAADDVVVAHLLHGFFHTPSPHRFVEVVARTHHAWKSRS